MNAFPRPMRSAVTEPASTATATSLGSRQTWTTRLAVIRFTLSPWRLPMR